MFDQSKTSLDYFRNQVMRVNLVRWVIFSIALITVLIFFREIDSFLFLILFIAFSFLISFGFQWYYSRTNQPIAFSRVFVFQLGIDVISIVIGAHIGGGELTLIWFLYLIHLSLVAIFLPLRPLVVLAIIEISAYLVQMEFYFRGWIHPMPMPTGFFFDLPILYLRGLEFVYVTVLILCAIWLSSHTRLLERARKETVAQKNFQESWSKVSFLSLNYMNLKNLYQILADHLGEIFDADGAYLTQWDDEHDTTIKLAAYGYMRQTYPSDPTPPGTKTITASLNENKKVLAIEDAYHSEYVSPDVLAGSPTRSVLALPLYNFDDQNFWGAALISYHQIRKFNTEDIQRAYQVADHVSLILSRAHFHQMTLDQVELLGELSQQVANLTLEENQISLLNAIVESTRTLLKSQRAALFLYDSEQKKISCLCSVGLSEKYIEVVLAHYQQSLRHDLIENNSHLLVSDILRGTHPLPNSIYVENSRGIAFFEFMLEEMQIGILGVYWDEPHEITPSETTIARVFANRAVSALRNASKYALVTEQSLTDSLTGLYNRRAFEARLEDEIQRAKRYGHSLSVIMLDLDHFKQINDKYGHSVGDVLLQSTASALRASIRKTDFVARYGGDEFTIIVLEAGSSVDVVCENIQLAVSALGANTWNIEKIPVSVSLGVATYSQDGETANSLLSTADKRMYEAKQTL